MELRPVLCSHHLPGDLFWGSWGWGDGRRPSAQRRPLGEQVRPHTLLGQGPAQLSGSNSSELLPNMNPTGWCLGQVAADPVTGPGPPDPSLTPVSPFRL